MTRGGRRSRSGPRPTPTHLRLLQGNPSKRRIREDQPDEPDTPVEIPPWLRSLDVAGSGLLDLTLADLRERAKALAIPRRSRLSRDELVDAILEADPGPRELGWQELAPMLESMRVLTAADVPALAMTVAAYADYIELLRFIAEQGPTYETDTRHGLQVKRRPEVAMAATRWSDLLRGLTEFGMTPASRTKVSAVPKDNKGKGIAGLRKKSD